MQAIILAAGKSTRSYPLTVNNPKSLLKITNETILEHSLKQLDGLVDEVILVVGFGKKQLKQFVETINYKIKINFVEQKEQLGTGHAVQSAKHLIKDRFIVMNGDDLYSRKDIEECLKHELSLHSSSGDPRKFGALEVKNGYLVKIHEKSENPPSNLINTGLYVVNKKVFDQEVEKSPRGEIEFTDMVTALAKTDKISVVKEKDYWIPVGYPWHVLDANEFLLKRLNEENNGKVEKNATIKGIVSIGKGTIVKNGAYIEGPVLIGENCSIGPNCYIRSSTAIGNGCKIGNAVEIKNSVIMDNVSIGHLSYIGDSIIGEGTNIGAGTITANLRHDNKNIWTIVKDQKTDTGRRKLGTVTGENVHLGINTSIYPGRKIWPGKTTLPGEIVKEDIMD